MKIGIALSGGGMRGIAHAGVLKALEENDIKIDIIGGTSSGSLVASLYAMGYSPYYIYLLFQRYAKDMVSMDLSPIFNGVEGLFKNKKFQIVGLNNGKNIEKEYNNLALRKGVKTISDISMPIIIPSVDINTAKEYIFTNCDIKNRIINKNKKENKEEIEENYISNIPVGTAVRASSSFPGIFCPCEYEGHNFLDGGILNNIPVKEIKKQGADIVIAVNFKADEVNEESNIMDITMRTIDIMGNKISEKSLKKYSDFIITIETDKMGLLDYTKLEVCYNKGYEMTNNVMNQILKLVK